jgi:hypothetical protein
MRHDTDRAESGAAPAAADRDEAADPYGTASVRSAVLAAWRGSPARFREDANAEEDLVLGSYRDRLVIELAQNAGDAALRAGRPGRLRLTLRQDASGAVLIAANTGAPLDHSGVESLSTLRASTKREGGGSSVGRFGVGFAAVLAVTDSPSVLSATGGVRWSAARTRELVAAIPELAEELTSRQGHVAVLRLPFEASGEPPEGFDTAVVLPLRDAGAVELVVRLLASVDDALLLALPGLSRVEIEVGGRLRELHSRREGLSVLIDDDGSTTRWHVVTRAGRLAPELVADRPVEERARPVWSVTWAVPTREGVPAPLPARTPAVVHAPTPTDDVLDLPALLLATFPLDASRRRVAPGPLRAFLVDAAAAAYGDLVRQLAGDARLGPEGGALALIPGPVAAGELDAELRRAVLARLSDTPFLPSSDGSHRLRPRDAVMIRGASEALVGALAPVLGELVPAGWAVSSLARLGVRAVTIPEVVDSLAELDRAPAWWSTLYDALSGTDPEALRGLPVPLADGRLVRDPRGVLLPNFDDADEVPVEMLAPLGLRLAHPDAVHPLLERLGARRTDALAVLTDPQVRALAASLWDADDDEREAVVAALLALVAAAGLAPGELPWLAELPLPDAAGELAPAGELLLPGAALASILVPGELGTVDPDLAERHGPEVLRAVGVLDSFAVVRDADVGLDADSCDHDLDAEADWVAHTRASPAGSGSRHGSRDGGAPELVTEFVAVRDLDLVAPDAWPAALRLLASPPLRSAVTEPVRVLRSDGRGVDVTSYSAWWLSTHPVLGGRRPADLRLPGSDPRLAGLWDELPAGAATVVDPEFARVLGVRVGLAEVLASPAGPEDLLDRLTDPAREVDRDQLAAVYAALAELDPERVSPRGSVRVPAGSGSRLAPAADVMIVDAPDLAPLLVGSALLPAPPSYAGALADVLGLPLAGEEIAAPVRGAGAVVRVPDEVRRVLAGTPAQCPDTYVEHETLRVRGPRGTVEVDWRWVGGVLHVATTDGLGAGLAWAAGDWSRRWLVCAVLESPERVEQLLFEDEFTRR